MSEVLFEAYTGEDENMVNPRRKQRDVMNRT